MPIIDGMLQELDQEAATTRRVLERVPNEQLAWRPHEKARTLGELALSVYLKQLDVPIPSIYGPSADENPFT